MTTQKNAFTKKAYKGNNQKLLTTAAAALGFESNEWATIDAWSAHRYIVPMGSTGIACKNFLRFAINEQTGKLELIPKHSRRKCVAKKSEEFVLYNRDQVVLRERFKPGRKAKKTA